MGSGKPTLRTPPAAWGPSHHEALIALNRSCSTTVGWAQQTSCQCKMWFAPEELQPWQLVGSELDWTGSREVREEHSRIEEGREPRPATSSLCSNRLSRRAPGRRKQHGSPPRHCWHCPWAEACPQSPSSPKRGFCAPWGGRDGSGRNTSAASLPSAQEKMLRVWVSSTCSPKRNRGGKGCATVLWQHPAEVPIPCSEHGTPLGHLCPALSLAHPGSQSAKLPVVALGTGAPKGHRWHRQLFCHLHSFAGLLARAWAHSAGTSLGPSVSLSSACDRMLGKCFSSFCRKWEQKRHFHTAVEELLKLCPKSCHSLLCCLALRGTRGKTSPLGQGSTSASGPVLAGSSTQSAARAVVTKGHRTQVQQLFLLADGISSATPEAEVAATTPHFSQSPPEPLHPRQSSQRVLGWPGHQSSRVPQIEIAEEGSKVKIRSVRSRVEK